MSEGREEESDQLPEEGPAGQTHEDDSGSESRSEATENAGAAGEEEGSQDATGNPANAGQD
jgi:hypothetical protein